MWSNLAYTCFWAFNTQYQLYSCYRPSRISYTENEDYVLHLSVCSYNDTLFAPGTLCSVAVRISYGMFQYLRQSVHILHLSLFYVKRRINIIYSMVCFKMWLSRVCTTSLSIFWQMAHSLLIKWKLVSKQFQMTATKASVHTVYSLKNNEILYYLKIKVMTCFVSFSR